MAENNFEGSLKEIEKIIQDLEKGDKPLDTQLKAFEKGIALSRDCLRQLEEVERKVELLVADGDGSLKTVPFESPATPV
ncbi:MAG: exodeoxyribonuclease VII small subunit [Deltaproteobacteria bacterium]|nr:exodeoxyribonuclease VII small subunit [Deltaproteobacteria bacterium]MBI3293128.1 exodeoxyribonuclease VII small subunit [Deltaproteobacteria bacterium]